MAHLTDGKNTNPEEGLADTMSAVGEISELGLTGLQETAWIEVISKMEEVYSDLIRYDVDLEKKNAELEDTHKFVDSVISSMSELLIVCDRNQRVEQVNKATEEVTGFKAQELVGQNLRDLVLNPESCMISELCTPKSMVHADYCEVRLKSKNDQGGTDPVSMNGSVRIDHRGRPAGVVIIGRPMGELRRAYKALNKAHADLVQAQQRLVQSEKMASLGRLVAGVAHELNNPISFINGNIHSLEKYKTKLKDFFDGVAASDDGSEEHKRLRRDLNIDAILDDLDPLVDGTLEGVSRVSDIVKNLRRLSFSGTQERQAFDLAKVVRTSSSWVKRGGPRPVEVSLDLPESLEVLGYEGRIHQVIVNLVENAFDAVANIDDPHIEVRVETKGDDALIKVTDNGCGIDAEQQLSVFDPFFTTKGVGQGTGLGLWISYDIVQEHGGELTLKSQTGKGATFTVSIPL